MTLGFYIALFITDRGLHAGDAPLLISVYFSLLQFLIVTAVTLLFSSFSTPIFSAIFAFALFVIGTFADDLRDFASAAHGLTGLLATGTAYLVPNFSTLNVISRVAHDQRIAGALIIYNSVYALLYSAAVTAAAVLVFERRNLK
jgi:hypothetical protein